MYFLLACLSCLDETEGLDLPILRKLDKKMSVPASYAQTMRENSGFVAMSMRKSAQNLNKEDDELNITAQESEKRSESLRNTIAGDKRLLQSAVYDNAFSLAVLETYAQLQYY